MDSGATKGMETTLIVLVGCFSQSNPWEARGSHQLRLPHFLFGVLSAILQIITGILSSRLQITLAVISEPLHLPSHALPFP